MRSCSASYLSRVAVWTLPKLRLALIFPLQSVGFCQFGEDLEILQFSCPKVVDLAIAKEVLKSFALQLFRLS